MLQITADFRDFNAYNEDVEELTQTLFEQLKFLEEVDRVDRLRETPEGSVKAGSKELGKLISGILMAEVSLPNLEPVVRFFFSRLTGKKIKLKVTANNRSIELEASSTSQSELLTILRELEDFTKEVGRWE